MRVTVGVDGRYVMSLCCDGVRVTMVVGVDGRYVMSLCCDGVRVTVEWTGVTSCLCVVKG